MQVIAERYREQFPVVYKFVMNLVYVDDGTCSVDTIEEAYALVKNTSYVLSQGSFNVKHFIIGGNQVEVTEEDIASDLHGQVRLGNSCEKVLNSRKLSTWRSHAESTSLRRKREPEPSRIL